MNREINAEGRSQTEIFNHTSIDSVSHQNPDLHIQKHQLHLHDLSLVQAAQRQPWNGIEHLQATASHHQLILPQPQLRIPLISASSLSTIAPIPAQTFAATTHNFYTSIPSVEQHINHFNNHNLQFGIQSETPAKKASTNQFEEQSTIQQLYTTASDDQKGSNTELSSATTAKSTTVTTTTTTPAATMKNTGSSFKRTLRSAGSSSLISTGLISASKTTSDIALETSIGCSIQSAGLQTNSTPNDDNKLLQTTEEAIARTTVSPNAAAITATTTSSSGQAGYRYNSKAATNTVTAISTTSEVLSQSDLTTVISTTSTVLGQLPTSTAAVVVDAHLLSKKQQQQQHQQQLLQQQDQNYLQMHLQLIQDNQMSSHVYRKLNPFKTFVILTNNNIPLNSNNNNINSKPIEANTAAPRKGSTKEQQRQSSIASPSQSALGCVTGLEEQQSQTAPVGITTTIDNNKSNNPTTNNEGEDNDDENDDNNRLSRNRSSNRSSRSAAQVNSSSLKKKKSKPSPIKRKARVSRGDRSSLNGKRRHGQFSGSSSKEDHEDDEDDDEENNMEEEDEDDADEDIEVSLGKKKSSRPRKRSNSHADEQSGSEPQVIKKRGKLKKRGIRDLTTDEKWQVYEDYDQIQSYRGVGRMFNMDHSTVKLLILRINQEYPGEKVTKDMFLRGQIAQPAPEMKITKKQKLEMIKQAKNEEKLALEMQMRNNSMQDPIYMPANNHSPMHLAMNDDEINLDNIEEAVGGGGNQHINNVGPGGNVNGNEGYEQEYQMPQQRLSKKKSSKKNKDIVSENQQMQMFDGSQKNEDGMMQGDLYANSGFFENANGNSSIVGDTFYLGPSGQYEQNGSTNQYDNSQKVGGDSSQLVEGKEKRNSKSSVKAQKQQQKEAAAAAAATSASANGLGIPNLMSQSSGTLTAGATATVGGAQAGNGIPVTDENGEIIANTNNSGLPNSAPIIARGKSTDESKTAKKKAKKKTLYESMQFNDEEQQLFAGDYPNNLTGDRKNIEGGAQGASSVVGSGGYAGAGAGRSGLQTNSYEVDVFEGQLQLLQQNLLQQYQQGNYALNNGYGSVEQGDVFDTLYDDLQINIGHGGSSQHQQQVQLQSQQQEQQQQYAGDNDDLKLEIS